MTEQLPLFAAPAPPTAAPLERSAPPPAACGCSETVLCAFATALWSEYAELWGRSRRDEVRRQVEIGSAYAGHRREALGVTAPSILGNCWPLMDDTYVGGTRYVPRAGLTA